MQNSNELTVTINGEAMINSAGETTTYEYTGEANIGSDASSVTNNVLQLDGFLTALASIVTIVALLLIIWEKAGKEKQIVYKSRNIFKRYKDMCTRFVFWNTSKKVLKDSDFAKDNYITIETVNENVELKKVSVIAQYKEGYCNLRNLKIVKNKCQLRFDKLYKGQGFIIDVSYTGCDKKDLKIIGSTLEYDVECVSSIPTMFGYAVLIIKIIAAIFVTLIAAIIDIAVFTSIPNIQLQEATNGIMGIILIALICLVSTFTSVVLWLSVYLYFCPKYILQKAFKGD